ncbi:MAG: hypothetical protein MJZ61_08150 [Bacteroidales bacterium]|nr:hypothetical protein [Bacteroidales bacterium]
MDPFCHVEVVSGSPALFSFNTIQDLVQGKTLSYTSMIRVTYFKPPKRWWFCVRSMSDIFDGPSFLANQIVVVDVEDFYFNTIGNSVAAYSDAHWWNVSGYRRLHNNNDVFLAQGEVFSKNSFPGKQTLYFVVRFKIQADANYTDLQLTDKLAGYYASQAVFFMKTNYFDE